MRLDRIGVRRLYVGLLLLALAVAGVVTFDVWPDGTSQPPNASLARAWTFVMATFGFAAYAGLSRCIHRRGADSDDAFVLLWPRRIMLPWGIGHSVLWAWLMV